MLICKPKGAFYCVKEKVMLQAKVAVATAPHWSAKIDTSSKRKYNFFLTLSDCFGNIWTLGCQTLEIKKLWLATLNNAVHACTGSKVAPTIAPRKSGTK